METKLLGFEHVLLQSVASMSSFRNVVLRAGPYSFPVHDVVLASHSHLLKQILLTSSAHDLEVIEGHIIVLETDVDPELVRQIVIFMYTGVLTIPASDKPRLSRLASSLGLDPLSRLLYQEEEEEILPSIVDLMNPDLLLEASEVADMTVEVLGEGWVDLETVIPNSIEEDTEMIRNHDSKFITTQSSEEFISSKSERKKKPFSCSLCHRTFVSEYGVRSHTKHSHSVKNYQCTDCPRAFVSERLLRIHRNSHSGDRPFECGICGKRFFNANNLRSHEVKTHTEPNLPCPECDRKFHFPTLLKEHVETIHFRIRRHECVVCGKCFLCKKHLRTHLKGVHLGNKYASNSEVILLENRYKNK